MNTPRSCLIIILPTITHGNAMVEFKKKRCRRNMCVQCGDCRSVYVVKGMAVEGREN